MDISDKYRQELLKRQKAFKSVYKKLFDKVASDISMLASDPNAKFTKSFNFSKPIQGRIDTIIADFNDEARKLTEQEISEAWKLSNKKNDAIAKNYLTTITGLKPSEQMASFIPNLPALEAFINRGNNAESLSKAVWKMSQQLKGELEIHLGLGIMNGDSTQVISRRIRQYLDNPNALFRRVRDKNGKLVASKAMIKNAPGQGKYNSAYKNAMRVARTEVNQAYLLSDHLRWNNMDFVYGVKISLSAQHPKYDYLEICEACAGEYPKEFKFTGWHSQCLCHATPVLMPQDNFEKELAGEKVAKQGIKDVPENFKTHLRDNFERYSGYKSKPYWIKDNPKIVDKVVKSSKFSKDVEKK